MNHKTAANYIIFWSSFLTVFIISHTTNGLLTASNDLPCSHVQCPTKCPEDSYLKSAIENEQDDFDDYQDEFLGHHDPYIEEIGNFEEIPPELELHDDSLPQHILKERQRREVFFQDDIERCCDDQKCVCHKCPDVPKCAEGYIAVEVQEGRAVPGNCCSVFRCSKKEQCQLGVKQSWWSNKCRKCSCFGQNELCEQICAEEETLKSCYSEYWQKPMLNGVLWKEGSCTSCSCEQGERRCFTPLCAKLNCPETIKIEGECCAKCLHTIIDDALEVEQKKQEEFEEKEDFIESTTIDTSIVDDNKELNLTLNHDHSNIPVDDDNLYNETETIVHKSKEHTTSMPNIKQDISTTLQPEIAENFSIWESSTYASSSSSTLLPILNIVSSVITTTEDVLKTTSEELQKEPYQDSSTPSTSSEATASKTLVDQDFTTTTEEDIKSTTVDLPTYDPALSEASEELSTTDRVTVTEKMETNIEQNKSSSTSMEEYSEETSKPDETTTTMPLESTMPNLANYDLEADKTVSANKPADVTSYTSNSATATTNMISTSSTPLMLATHSTTTAAPDFMTTTQSITIAPTTAKDLTSSPATSSEQTSSAATSSPTLTTAPASTTSSPYSTTGRHHATLDIESTTSPSSTSAPGPLRPLFQSYGDVTSEEGSTTTQNQMRIVFDEIDYVVLIGLFIGSLLCISLGLIIRHTKNRKRMYSSVPNSETSLSQNSTNTVLTIPSYRDNGYSSAN